MKLCPLWYSFLWTLATLASLVPWFHLFIQEFFGVLLGFFLICFMTWNLSRQYSGAIMGQVICFLSLRDNYPSSSGAQCPENPYFSLFVVVVVIVSGEGFQSGPCSSYVLISQSCQNKVLQTGWFKTIEISQFWRLESQNQDFSRAMLPLKTLEKNLSLALPSIWWLLESLVFLGCGCTYSFSAHIFTWPSSHGISQLCPLFLWGPQSLVSRKDYLNLLWPHPN